MSLWKFNALALTCLAPIIFTPSCGNSSASAWQAAVPGEYRGSAAGFTETIRLRSNGTFEHEVLIDGKPPLKESGTWTVDNGGSALRVEGFSRFFDPATHKLTKEPQRLAVDVLFPSPQGNKVNQISTDVHFGYYLTRVPTEAPPDNTKRPGEGAKG